jgi:hypothetical protein
LRNLAHYCGRVQWSGGGLRATGRHGGCPAARLLGELYGALRLFTNLFQPSFKLKCSVRESGRIKRQHHPPRTPLQRLLATGQLSKEKARALQELQQSSDPMALLETIRHQAQLALLASGEQAPSPGGTTTAVADPDAENHSLESFLSGLQLM